MSRFVVASASLIGFVLVGCSSDDHYQYKVKRPAVSCSMYETCGVCTAVVGCGWCSNGDGTGTCASSAASCRGKTFRWNWDPIDCPVPSSDAGVDASEDAASEASTDASPTSDGAPVDDASSEASPVDAASEASPVDAPAEASDDAGSDAADAEGEAAPADAATDASPSDAAPVCKAPDTLTPGCVRTLGGTLCGAGQYTVGCHTAGAAPDASLKCTKALESGGSTYHCCPCLAD